MISVAARDAEREAVCEFFELFKTPWEFYQGGDCEALICSDPMVNTSSAKLVLLFQGEETAFDRQRGIVVAPENSKSVRLSAGERIPIYGRCLRFRSRDSQLGPSVLMEVTFDGRRVVRLGYDLFQEVKRLLASGQPEENAESPALESHIALLRDLLLRQGLPLVEIPPVPDGYPFIACLTHDVDHVGIRNHKFDHTMLGFLARATLGTTAGLLKGTRSVRQLRANYAAALSLPLVYLGLARDFWNQFDRYCEIERGLTSTYFVIPSKGDPGTDAHGSRQWKRAAKYEIQDIARELCGLRDAGHEIGVHGIDAWRDSRKGRQELERVRNIVGGAESGVRMHWLYFGEGSPAVLEEAGFSYDSTCGYNGAVGYRAGTTQAFKPLEVRRMLELPMHVMDTALFFPDRMNLSPNQARQKVSGLLQNAGRFGGALTVNWHDRSIAPERLWDDFYVRLLHDLKTHNAWFATAGQTVSWFRKRREARFGAVTREDGGIRISASLGQAPEQLPALRLRIHSPSQRGQSTGRQGGAACSFADIPFNKNVNSLFVKAG